MDELRCTEGDEKETLDAAEGGTAEGETGREQLWMPAHGSRLPSYEHTHSDLSMQHSLSQATV